MEPYITLQGWMLELGLKPGELIAFAVIYSFGKDGDWFHGSASYLGKWMGVKKKDNVIKALSSLVKKGLIEKRERWENGQKLCDYRPSPKRGRGIPKSGTGGIPESGIHNNRPDSDSDKKEIYKESGEVHLSVDEFLSSHRR